MRNRFILLATLLSLAAAPALAWPGAATYHHASPAYRIDYWPSWTLNTAYNDTVSNPAMPGVAFVIPASLTTGTNLVPDSNVSVETVPAGGACDPSVFEYPAQNVHVVEEDGRSWQVGSFVDGAAGSFVKSIVFVLTNSRACYAVTYFIHYHDIGVYPPGTVTPFDEPALIAKFDKIRLSLRIP